MAIEIKELIVKTSVDNGINTGDKITTNADIEFNYQIERIKTQIMAECREMVYNLLNEKSER